MNNDYLECSPANAEKLKWWIETRGGIAVWRSIDLSNPGKSWSTPLLQADGEKTPPPSWQFEKTPGRIITKSEEVMVVSRKEVARFRIAIRPSFGFNIKLTDASSKKVSKALEKYGEEASYYFEDREAVITVPDKKVLLSDWNASMLIELSLLGRSLL
jgi:hypothetical protein